MNLLTVANLPLHVVINSVDKHLTFIKKLIIQPCTKGSGINRDASCVSFPIMHIQDLIIVQKQQTKLLRNTFMFNKSCIWSLHLIGASKDLATVTITSVPNT